MKAKKIINSPDDIAQETADGFVSAYQERIMRYEGTNVIAQRYQEKDKVAVVIGNGAGHEPACIGFVGKNMLTANAFGDMFTAPSPDIIYDMISRCNGSAGTCVLISNHAGDVINAKMAIDMAQDDGYNCKGVILYDDIASAPKENMSDRRGTVGTLFNYKITGSYAAEGHSLDEVVKISEKVRDNTRTIAAAIAPGTSPITGEKMFEIADDEIEIGIGVHGEAAAHTMKMCTSKELAEFMTNLLVKDKPYQKGEKVAVIVNGCGSTTLMEQLIFFQDVKNTLAKDGIEVFHPAIGSFITTQEMAGISLSFCLMDDELERCWMKETDAPYFKL